MNIPLLNQPVNAKVRITIILTDDGRIMSNCTSTNLITILGMLEAFKKTVNPVGQAIVEGPRNGGEQEEENNV